MPAFAGNDNEASRTIYVALQNGQFGDVLLNFLAFTIAAVEHGRQLTSFRKIFGFE